MEKKNDIKKEVIKIKKSKDSKINKRRKQSEPDLWKEMRSSWKEIRKNLKPLKKAYDKFQSKRKIAKQKEEERRLKENEKQRLLEEESLRLQEQEERKLKNKEEQRLKEEEQRLKEEEQRLKEEEQRLKAEEQRLKEEKINSKEVKELDDGQEKKRLNGTVKWFNVSKGYGFIKREDKEKDVFVHSSAVENSGLKYLKKDEQLTFEVESSDKGPSAVNLQKITAEVFHSHLKVVK